MEKYMGKCNIEWSTEHGSYSFPRLDLNLSQETADQMVFLEHTSSGIWAGPWYRISQLCARTKHKSSNTKILRKDINQVTPEPHSWLTGQDFEPS